MMPLTNAEFLKRAASELASVGDPTTADECARLAEIAVESQLRASIMGAGPGLEELLEPSDIARARLARFLGDPVNVVAAMKQRRTEKNGWRAFYVHRERIPAGELLNEHYGVMVERVVNGFLFAERRVVTVAEVEEAARYGIDLLGRTEIECITDIIRNLNEKGLL